MDFKECKIIPIFDPSLIAKKRKIVEIVLTKLLQVLR